MVSPYELVNKHVEAALMDAAQYGIPPETVAGNLLAEAVRVLKLHRPLADVRSELMFAMDNIEEQDFTFMRP